MAKQPQRRPQPQPQPKKAAPAPAPVRRKEKSESLFSAGRDQFIFSRMNFIIIGAGLGLVLLGLLTMSGGAMPDANTWDPNLIYSFRRITLAPFLMLAGFVAVIYGIFKKSTPVADRNEGSPPAT